MAHITLDIPSGNIPLLMEIAAAMGLETEHMISKNESPEWHKNVLNERSGKYNSGKTNLTSWDDFEKEID
jgi:hypothetical protein